MEQLTLVTMCTKCGIRPAMPWDGRTRRSVRCEKCSTARYRMKYKQRYKGDPVEAERMAARKAVNYAKERGWIVPAPCAVCRSTENLQGHHHDYAQKLNVTWLCAKCHKAVDQLLDIFPMAEERWLELSAWCPLPGADAVAC